LTSIKIPVIPSNKKGFRMFKLKDFRKEHLHKKSLKKEDVDVLISLREEEADLSTKLDVVKGFREKKEMEIYSAINSGASTDHLPWKIILEKVYRVYPAWKVLFIRALGLKKAEEATKKTRRTGYIDVIVWPK
jgi:hypothetical protein